MVLVGYAHLIAGDLSPTAIIAPDYASSGDPALLAAHCLAGVDATLAEQVREGDILIVRGRVGPACPAPPADAAQHEAAVLALQALGVAALVCAQAEPALATLAGSYGLPLVVLPAAAQQIGAGHSVRLHLARGTVTDQISRQTWQATPCAAPTLAAVQRAQIFTRMRRVVEDEGFAE